MAERIGSWLAGLGVRLLAWFDHLDGWVQFVVIVCVALVFVALAHLDDLARVREWHEFKSWQESKRRALKGMKR